MGAPFAASWDTDADAEGETDGAALAVVLACNDDEQETLRDRLDESERVDVGDGDEEGFDERELVRDCEAASDVACDRVDVRRVCDAVPDCDSKSVALAVGEGVRVHTSSVEAVGVSMLKAPPRVIDAVLARDSGAKTNAASTRDGVDAGDGEGEV